LTLTDDSLDYIDAVIDNLHYNAHVSDTGMIKDLFKFDIETVKEICLLVQKREDEPLIRAMELTKLMNNDILTALRDICTKNGLDRF
jgi:hypothetical protein